MELLEKIKVLMNELNLESTKSFGGNKSAGTRARKLAQELKGLLQELREEILEERKKVIEE